MAKTGLDWDFIDAIDGGSLDISQVAYNAKKVRKLLGFELTPKEIGCYLSHMECWRACVRKKQITLIFEDDFIVEPIFGEVLEKIMQCNVSWDIVRLQALVDSSFQVVADFENFKLVKNKTDPLGATAYLVNPRSAQALLENSKEIYEPLDHYIEHVEKHGMIMTAIYPYPVTVFDKTRSTSTITDRPERMTIQGVKKFYRSLMRVWDRHFSKNPWFPK